MSEIIVDKKTDLKRLARKFMVASKSEKLEIIRVIGIDKRDKNGTLMRWRLVTGPDKGKRFKSLTWLPDGAKAFSTAKEAEQSRRHMREMDSHWKRVDAVVKKLKRQHVRGKKVANE